MREINNISSPESSKIVPRTQKNVPPHKKLEYSMLWIHNASVPRHWTAGRNTMA